MALNDDEILELKMTSEIGETTIREWLRELLLTLWREGESFSGKRPFGNSGWEYDAYRSLVEAGVISGKLDDYGFVEECDEKTGCQVVGRLIAHVFSRSSN